VFFRADVAQTRSTSSASHPDQETGIAAYYGNWLHGGRTASGERYNKDALSAAHNHYAFGTQLRVTNLENQKSVVVTVNDRGPTTPGRIIDVSRRVAAELGFLRSGLTEVKLEVVK
jgi:rare lipoprotein A